MTENQNKLFDAKLPLLVQFVCHFHPVAMLEGLDSFCNDWWRQLLATGPNKATAASSCESAMFRPQPKKSAKNFARVTWNRPIFLVRMTSTLRKHTTCSYICALDEGPFNLIILCQRKRFNIKLADNKPTLTLYWMLLKDRSTKGHSCVLFTACFQCLKLIRITRLLTDSTLAVTGGGDNDRRQVLRHFVQ